MSFALLNLGSVNIGDILLKEGSTTNFNHPISYRVPGKPVIESTNGEYNEGSMRNEAGANLKFGDNLTMT